jgi:hypothetical protein
VVACVWRSCAARARGRLLITREQGRGRIYAMSLPDLRHVQRRQLPRRMERELLVGCRRLDERARCEMEGDDWERRGHSRCRGRSSASDQPLQQVPLHDRNLHSASPYSSTSVRCGEKTAERWADPVWPCERAADDDGEGAPIHSRARLATT